MANTTTYLAWQGLFPYKRLGSPFFWIGTLGVGLGVMLLIIVISVMEGFGATYKQKIVELGGDIRVEGTGYISQPDSLLQTIEKDPAIAAAAPFGQGFMMIEHNHRPAFPVVRGIDPEREGKVVLYKKVDSIEEFGTNEGKGAQLVTLGQEGINFLDDEGVFLSTLLAKQIGAKLGDSVDLYTPLMISKLGKDELLLPKSLKVTGIYQTGWHDFDQNTMLISLPTFQELYGLGDSVHGITLRLKSEGSNTSNKAPEAVKTRLIGQLGSGYNISTWKELFRDFLWVLDLEKNMMFFLMLFVVLVAAFAMGAAQLMTVLRKTREIGLIMAMGSTTWAVSAIYALQGAIVGVIGVIVGNIFALTFLYFRNPILHTIAGWTGSTETLIQFYQFYDLPMSYSISDALIIGGAAVILATISGLVPAIMVSKLKPAEALRNE